MPSPFPGMDPFLESPSYFGVFHSRFIAALGDFLTERLPPNYVADPGSRIWIEESERPIYPDLGVLQRNFTGQTSNVGGTAVAERDPRTDVEPVIVTLADDEQTETFLEIRYLPEGERLVTAIELLSPSNKAPGSDGRPLYLQKQKEMLRSDVNFLEIDFLRGGVHTTLAPRRPLQTPEGECSYHIVLRAAAARFQRVVYRIQLWHRLPVLKVPLLPKDGSIEVPLQPVFDRCYEVGRYAMRIDYSSPPPPPPLRPHEAEYVSQRLAEAFPSRAGDTGAAPTS